MKKQVKKTVTKKVAVRKPKIHIGASTLAHISLEGFNKEIISKILSFCIVGNKNFN